MYCLIKSRPNETSSVEPQFLISIVNPIYHRRPSTFHHYLLSNSTKFSNILSGERNSPPYKHHALPIFNPRAFFLLHFQASIVNRWVITWFWM
ncbi:hypothetical protein L1987_72878 [Smallanthus sonchifolius]|uniref:Uncharacterized protein n=1 Tax=Smallanthus sonchifolius TaxID=185202 RepID=A0ACB9AXS0_9ASTR|nr:hypothetical protein L1987_72878 [Smallanthus sonchifolius]